MDYNLHCRVAVGVYAPTRNLTRDGMSVHTKGALAMESSSTYQDGMELYSLDTSNILHRRCSFHYIIALMPVDAIQRVAY